MDISLLRNPVQHYPWGSRSAIADFLGKATSAEPEAELWMGAHPKAPSEVRVADEWIPLDRLIERDPVPVLGPRATEFPFLFKILAAAQPLSIQAHPNLEQARDGFAREERLGPPRDARERNYRDANSKPELVYALTPFRMLRGFRPISEIRDLIKQLDLIHSLPGAHALGDDPQSLANFFRACSPSDPTERQRLQPLLDLAVERAAAQAEEHAVYACIGELARFYPGDPGLLAPLYLQLIELAPGEVIFTGPGVLHAYLNGLGIELMSNSDNVLRSSLTAKHIDVPELMSILTFEPTSTDRMRPTKKANGDQSFIAPDHSFELRAFEVDEDQPRRETSKKVAILLCRQGRGWIRNLRSGQHLVCSQGDALLVPASVEVYEIGGQAAFFQASAGPSPTSELDPLPTSMNEISFSTSGFRA